MRNSKKRATILWVTLALSVVSASAIHALGHKVKRVILPNGLTVLVKEDHRSPIVAMKAFIKVGAEHETERFCGIRNFCQSLLLKGTRERSALDIALDLESAGNLIDTFTTPDYLEVSVVTTTGGLNVGLDILSDVLQNPIFPDQEVAKERRVILAQIEQLKDDKFESAYELFRGAIYEDHPYGRPIRGTKESINEITRDDLIAFHKSHYLANNVVISVVGDVKAKDMIIKVSRAFEGFGTGSLPQVTELSTPKQTRARKVIRVREIEQAFFVYGFLAPSLKEKDYFALKVINAILGSGMSSRLFNLREKFSLAYEIGSFFPTRQAPSHYVIYLGTRPENLSRAEELIKAEIERIREELVSDEELARAKAFLLGKFALDHQQNIRQAWYLGWYEILGLGYKFDNIYPDLIEQVTSQDVRQVAKKYFNYPTLAILRPTESIKPAGEKVRKIKQ